MGAIRNLSRTLALCSAVLLLAASAQAIPLGLQVGDKIQQLEWDSDHSVSGDGGVWDLSQSLFHADGRVNSVQLSEGPSAPTITPGNVDMRFDLTLNQQYVDLSGSPWIFANSTLPGAGLMPDFAVKESGVNILWGNFSAPVYLEGNLNVNDDNPQPLLGVGKITILGGDATLVTALGGTGGQANLLLTASFFGFDPPLAGLASDGNIFNSDFNVSLSGTLIPINPSPFVPEPTTALLLGAGLLSLLAMGRRRNR